MKKFFFMAAALVASVTISAQTVEVFALDSAFGVSKGLDPTITKTADGPEIAAGTFYDGTAFSVNLPYATKMAIVGTAQPNGAHKKVTVGATEINVEKGIQGNDNPKDADGGNPANTLLEPKQAFFWQITAKVDGQILVFHKASSNKQYFVFENGFPVGYSFGMMTYADKTLGDNGLLAYTLTGDAELNRLTPENLLASTGFDKIAMVEDYFNDTLTSGIAWETYKQNGVGVIAFNAYKDCVYSVGAAGSKISASAIAFVNGANGSIVVTAKGETVTKDEVTTEYQDVTLLNMSLTALNDVKSDVKAQKMIENGQIVILKNGVKYTVLGTVAE